ncbi:GNAT family N-acetyltransferase [Falsirhodobacter algicola]|uniref:L-ornithine N(alpha)-acyltransferase n=1 Tax=Falsirhodobacter algicola TaxID=2692330 RepID=A0A8J8MRW7_9RHOB|nr:GNAT family N-acetyltransferase [Falsirhodobacter algicola]QUS35595.1 GNAT family N-acetyltransferase [Falsirhodobacter algicola]
MSVGRYSVREAVSAGDMARAQALRTQAFGLTAPDRDAFDPVCTHVLVEEGGDLVACYRFLRLMPEEVEQSYAAQHYDLSALRRFDGPMIEVGRFCLHPERHQATIVRAAWRALAGYITAWGARLVFGCSSFQGTQPDPYQDAFALLRQAHQAPVSWRPGVKAAQVFPYAALLQDHSIDMQNALRRMPPLLRSYLLMGGWVSDHAVLDNHMDTMHVFTGVELERIPRARAQLLRLA